jgi:ferredoxin
VVSGPESWKAEKQCSEYLGIKASFLKKLEEQKIQIMPWPHDIELNGSPGSYEAAVKYGSQTSHIKAGALILDLGDINREELPAVSAIFDKKSLLGRILARRCYSNGSAGVDSASLRDFTIKETSGIFIISPNEETPEEMVIKGAAAAARASAYLYQGILRPRATAVTIESILCRGCGDCAAICPYIGMKAADNGIPCAYVDQALCLGCGACIARCPTGAISQPLQSERQITSTLEALLGTANSMSGIR